MWKNGVLINRKRNNKPGSLFDLLQSKNLKMPKVLIKIQEINRIVQGNKNKLLKSYRYNSRTLQKNKKRRK